MNNKAKWIWDKENKKQNDWVMFLYEFEAIKAEKCMFEISADTRYFMWVNKQICIWDGGLFRDAYCENSGFIDNFDIAQYIKIGKNTLEILVWHYGNGGRNNNPLETAGVIFSCDELGVFSDEKTLCQRHKAFGETGEPLPAYLYGGYNIRYDANCTMNKSDFVPATVFESQSYGKLFEREIPMFKLYDVADAKHTKLDDTYIVKLPKALHVMPYLHVTAQGGEVIDIRNDRYTVNGGPGGGGVGKYNGHRTEYVCKKGENIFLNFDYMACEALEFKIPKTVKVEKLSYRISEYDTHIMDVFKCENKRVNILVQKSANTLKYCMRDNFMDCPDRERGQWIGDVSVQAPQVFFALDKNAVPLLKKAIFNFIYLRKGDVLVGNVPGINFSELPSQSLNAICEFGMIAKYYENTGDIKMLEICFEPMVSYLKLWHMGKNGMVERREGDWCWFDHLNNQDKPILENTWYYSALNFAKRVANILDKKHNSAFLQEQIDSIKNNFDELYWKGKYYTSGEIVDDRANAMAVLTGLAKPEYYEKIKNVLITTFNASTYMEGYICEALFLMGYEELGFNRMMNRYLPLIENENSTLWEDFALLGTKNHAWSGYPLNIFYKYIAGVNVCCEKMQIRLKPNFNILKKQKYEMQVANGVLSVDLEIINGKICGSVNNSSSFELIKDWSN